MRPDFTDQAHQDPSLGRMRPRAIATQRVQPGPVAPRRDWIRIIDRWFAIAVVFAGAVWFAARLFANAACGI